MAVLVFAAGSTKAIAWAEDASQVAIEQDIRMGQTNVSVPANPADVQAPNAAPVQADIQQDRQDIAKDVAERQKLLNSEEAIQSYISADLAGLQSDRVEVQRDRASLRSAHDDYASAVKTYGPQSQQALAAKDTMFKAQQELHQDIGTVKTMAGAVDFQRGALGRDQVALAQLQNDIDADKFDVNKDLAQTGNDRPEVQQDRAALRNKRDAFEDAKTRFGENSPECQAAKADLDRSQMILHRDVGDLPADQRAKYADLRKDFQDIRQDRQDIRQDRQEIGREVAEKQQLLNSQDAIQGYIGADLTELKSNSVEVTQDQTALRTAHDAYDDAVKKYGATSAQAQSAKDSMFKAQQALHQDLGTSKTLNDAVAFQRGALGRDQVALAQLQKDIDADKLDLKKDLQDIASDRADVKQDRAELRGKGQTFDNARKRFGDNSPEARDAKADLDRTQLALHHDIGDLPPDQMSRYGGFRAVGQTVAGTPASFDLNKDIQDIRSDKRDVRKDRKELRAARDSYEDTLRKNGADSAQAKAAQEQVYKRQTELHHDAGDLRKDIKDIRQDRRELAVHDQHHDRGQDRDHGRDHDRDRNHHDKGQDKDKGRGPDKNLDQHRDDVKRQDHDDQSKHRGDFDRDHAAPAMPTPNMNPGMPAR